MTRGLKLLISMILYFQLSTIHFLAAMRLAEFSNAFFPNVLQRRSGTYLAFSHYFTKEKTAT